MSRNRSRWSSNLIWWAALFLVVLLIVLGVVKLG